RRLVEAELLLQLLDEGRIQAAGAAVSAPLALDDAAAAAGEIAARPRYPLGRRATDLRQLCDRLLHRPARRRLHDDEVDDHDPEEGRDDQQQAPDDVGDHGAPPVMLRAVMPAASWRAAREGSRRAADHPGPHTTPRRAIRPLLPRPLRPTRHPCAMLPPSPDRTTNSWCRSRSSA